MDKKLLFISHKESDQEIASKLVDLVLASLDLKDDEVRCTSVPGHTLQYGKSISIQLKEDINISSVIIALITKESLKSKWVLFELGASWALGKMLVPILAPELTENNLPGPLSENLCIKIGDSRASSELIDALEQAASKLAVSTKIGSKRQVKLEEFVETFKSCKLSFPPAAKTGAIEEVSAKTDKSEKEMDKLVAPLHSKIIKDKDGTYRGVDYIFMKGSPGNIDSRRQRVQEFFKFWQNIKQNMHLAQGDLSPALKIYLDRKSNTLDDCGQNDPLYIDAEKKLIDAIMNRYSELIDKIR